MSDTRQDIYTMRTGSAANTITAASSVPWRNHVHAGHVQAQLSWSLLALIAPVLLFWTIKTYRKMQEKIQRPFPFLKLPQELRDMVYEHLVEDPVFPSPQPSSPTTSSMNWMLPRGWSSASSTSQHKCSNWMILANKQIHREFMDLLCKRATFQLTVSPQTFQPSSPSSTTFSLLTPRPMWKISPDTLKRLRSCDLQLVTTSGMLGVTDPRNMTSSDWTLARQIRQELTSLTSVKNLTLNAKAIGDPLWNPLWIWYHTITSFKNMGTPQADTIPIGPKLKRITFSLDTWSPGENYIQRDVENKDQWTWYCIKGHHVALDSGADMTVREFCGKLYQECKICLPGVESEGKDAEE